MPPYRYRLQPETDSAHGHQFHGRPFHAASILGLISHLDAEEIAKTDLSDIVDNILVVEEIRAIDIGVSGFLGHVRLVDGSVDAQQILPASGGTYHLDALERLVDTSGIFPLLWSIPALSPGCESLGFGTLLSGIIVSVSQFQHWIAEFCLAE
jgi:hypothetical protein